MRQENKQAEIKVDDQGGRGGGRPRYLWKITEDVAEVTTDRHQELEYLDVGSATMAYTHGHKDCVELETQVPLAKKI